MKEKTGIRDSAVDCRQTNKIEIGFAEWSEYGAERLGARARCLNSEMRKLEDYSICENKFRKISIQKHFSIFPPFSQKRLTDLLPLPQSSAENKNARIEALFNRIRDESKSSMYTALPWRKVICHREREMSKFIRLCCKS